MKILIFGLTISSSWGNGHATLWRGLCRALIARGHHVVFFERNAPYYAEHRDLHGLNGGEIVLFSDWMDIEATARRELLDADVAIVTSYCPDALSATDLVLSSPALSVFYDLDTPVTLFKLERGQDVPYIGLRGLQDFDLVLSYTGGPALEALRLRLGARVVAPLYGSVDPREHSPRQPSNLFRGDLSYLGTYATDRQDALERLFIELARDRPNERFLIAGAQYPHDFPWQPNIFFLRHLAPADHAAFFCSSRLTLNITRGAMAASGYCPSGRLFEAAACGAAIVSDSWPGLDEFFDPLDEILLASTAADVSDALDLPDQELRRIGRAARERVLAQHTAANRAVELEKLLESARTSVQPLAEV